VGVQHEADAARVRALGCRADAVRIVGNLKFDAAKIDGPRTLDVPALLRQLAVPANAKFLVAGSTHDGEEALLAEQFLRLKAKFPELLLVLVPRHFERAKSVGNELKLRGVKFVFRSELTASSQFKPGEVECLLVNTTGELRFFYEHATVVFVGKSLTAEGGQNPIEPGALGKAMVFGPNMQNFVDIARSFVEAKAAVQVRDAAELEKTFAELLADAPRRAELGQNALTVVQRNEGSLGRTVEMIMQHLEGGELYTQPRG
jgi:3-deoxy-D-manno-octulosonic-acid transferase